MINISENLLRPVVGTGLTGRATLMKGNTDIGAKPQKIFLFKSGDEQVINIPPEECASPLQIPIIAVKFVQGRHLTRHKETNNHDQGKRKNCYLESFPQHCRLDHSQHRSVRLSLTIVLYISYHRKRTIVVSSILLIHTPEVIARQTHFSVVISQPLNKDHRFWICSA